MVDNWRGVSNVRMSLHELCVIKSTTQMNGDKWIKGKIFDVCECESPPFYVRAKVCDERHIHDALCDTELPDRYEVRPRYSTIGFTSCVLHAGDACLIQIDNFKIDPALCANPGMSPDEVLAYFPKELIGIWNGRITEVSEIASTGSDSERLFRVRAVLADRTIADHPNKMVREWLSLEPATPYNVWPDRNPDHIYRSTSVLRRLKTQTDCLVTTA